MKINRWTIAALAARLLHRGRWEHDHELRGAWLSRLKERGEMNHPTRKDAKQTLDSMCLAIKPTAQQVQAACAAFASLIAFSCSEPVEIKIGTVLIARSK
jgi:hypothetical protein